MARPLLGVDLGTTHTVLSRGESGSAAPPEVVPVPQLVGPGAVEARPLLPSVLFAPPPGETVEDPFADAPFLVGHWARRRAAELPSRAVLSPKSWLAHAGVDRTAPILPWGADEAGTPRISPVEASRRILRHLCRATAAAVDWEAAGTVVLAVPASFDAVARELTERAAREAGLEVRLLEEPVAALHAWLAEQGEEALASLFDQGDEGLVLVCDVGGGTTDLTLVRASRARGAGGSGGSGAGGAG
ncbi:MAG: Hsp70 family protein, partial [Deltaproteobacteria bacterium]|nr:Hsp70 family protein [Deltaproteobacteria bacterium]